MTTAYHIILRLNDEERARVEKARRKLDLGYSFDEFLQHCMLGFVDGILDLDMDFDDHSDDELGGLTVEEHIQLAEEAENNWITLEEFEQRMKKHMERMHELRKYNGPPPSKKHERRSME